MPIAKIWRPEVRLGLKCVTVKLANSNDSSSKTMIVNDARAKSSILSALGDEPSRIILAATSQAPVSALDVSREYQIPLMTVYRRLEDLMEAGLVAVVRSTRAADGKWSNLYGSLHSRIDVIFDDDQTRNARTRCPKR